MRICLGLFAAAGAVLLAHCSSFPDTCRGDACGSSPEGSTDAPTLDGGADVMQPPAGCDPSADPKDAPKCVVSDFGVFVDAAGGSDANAGTKDSPVKTITAALGKLAGKSRVYVCEGTYDEHVKLTSAVSLYAGFACTSWSYSGIKAKLAPSTAGLALEVRGAAAALVVADLDLFAIDATARGESSIAAFVVSSAKVTLRRVAATAGKAQDGLDATAPAAFAPANAPDGTPGAAGGAQTPNPACATSIGGAGGKDGATNGGAGQVAIAPVFPVGNTGAGGTGGAACGAGGTATNGSYGIAGTPGAGAATSGTLDATGWKGNDGAPGGAGGNGQGGGGGAQIFVGGVGGSGGPGGCGGAGGPKGTAGGSSIALLVFESSVALEQTALTAKDAGRGGNGAKGQKAQLGSLAQASGNGANACAGGYGGIGGSGGGGGGGAGGLSAGILYKGTAPTVDGATHPAADTLPAFTLGQKGAGGAKGPGGDAAQTSAPASRPGQDGTPGAEGSAKAILSAP